MLVAEGFEKGTEMSFTDLATFDQVVSLVQAGHRQEAYVQVKALAKMDPTNTNLLLWLAYTTPDLHQAELAINKVAFLNPMHPSIVSAREWLANERRKQHTQARPIVVTIPPAEQMQDAAIESVSPSPARPVVAHPLVTDEAARAVEPEKIVPQPTIMKATTPVAEPDKVELAEVASQPVVTLEARKPGQLRIKGNIKTKVYHLPDGAFYAQMKRGNVEYFSSEDEAQAAGYRRSKN